MPQLILVVEDEPAVRRVTCRYLKAAGYNCVAAKSGADTLAFLDEGRIPDLLLIDIRLPDVPGPELALRIHTRYPRIPVLFVSGWPDAQASVRNLEAVRWEFLQKPYSRTTLAEAVRNLLTSEPA
jgi:CheY-like chemotaxis protein